ncbi:MAG: arylesterase [Rhodomicrobium sp.]|nr:arylesterase [Rhodomicrobium sp.]
MRHRSGFAPQRLIWTWILAFSTAAALFFSAQKAGAEDKAVPDKEEIVILAFGDSLTAGYMIPPGKSFPAQLQAALREKGYPVRVLNSGVSGDTAADGLARLDWSLDGKVDGAIVEFGANDALRGLDPKIIERSLDGILQSLRDKHIELLIAGMEAPRNWGEAYDGAFRAMYAKLAEKYGALFYPFFLKDVATVQSLNLSDGLHPTPEGVEIVVRNILPDAEKLIARIRKKRAMSDNSG